MSDIIGNKTLKKQWEKAAGEWADKLFMIYEDRNGNTAQATYKEMYDEICKASNLFIDLGVKKGEPVAVQLFNSPEFLMCWFGLAQIGAVIVPLNTGYKQTEINYILKKSGARIVVADSRLIDSYVSGDVYDLETPCFCVKATKSRRKSHRSLWKQTKSLCVMRLPSPAQAPTSVQCRQHTELMATKYILTDIRLLPLMHSSQST